MPLPSTRSAGLSIGSRPREFEEPADGRLPIPQAALIITALSLGLWLVIGYGVSLLLT